MPGVKLVLKFSQKEAKRQFKIIDSLYDITVLNDSQALNKNKKVVKQWCNLKAQTIKSFYIISINSQQLQLRYLFNQLFYRFN